MRAALPQIVERKGQIVVISSVYAFANGMVNSPYAVAKAGVESLGRTLRTELMPQGASATVAYFGWVDTKLVQDALAQDGRRTACSEFTPDWLLKRITPDEAAAGAGARDRRTRAAGLRAEVVALRLRPARHRQPAARPPHGARREIRTVLAVEADSDEQGVAAVSAAR